MTVYYVDDGGGKAVSAATNANPCQVTIVGHGFSNGHKVVFHNVGGMTQLNFTNGSTGYTVTRVDDDNITIGVDSSAYGTYTSGGTAHNGLSWGSSYTSLSALDDVFTLADGDIIYIGHDHVCQYAHTTTRGFVGPTSGRIYLISATQGSDPPTYQASSTNQIDTSEGGYGVALNGFWACYGVRFKCGTTFDAYNISGSNSYYESCTFAIGANQYLLLAQGDNQLVTLVNCTIDLTADGTSTRNGVVIAQTGGAMDIRGLSFVNAGYRTAYVFSGAIDLQWLNVSGADFSGFTNATTCEIYNGGNQITSNIVFTNCKTKSSPTLLALAPSSPGGVITFSNCSDADDPTQLYHVDVAGTTASNTAIYRSGGASVEGTACAWLVTTTATCYPAFPYRTPWIYGTLASSGSKTFTVYITNDTADFTDAEVWLEVEYLSTANEPQWAQAHDHASNIAVTGTAQTDDTTSTWVGTGPAFTYKQKLSVTATVNEEGQYRARVCVGKASIASNSYFYVDPDVTVT